MAHILDGFSAMVGESLAPACNGCYIQGSQGVRLKLVEVEEGAKARSEVG